jgi:hypothetical protein
VPVALALAVTLAGISEAGARGRAADLPSVELPQLPEVPHVPAVPQLPSVPAVPSPQVPAAPAPPALPSPNVPPTGGGAGKLTGRGGVTGGGSVGDAASVAGGGLVDAVAAGESGAGQGRQGTGPPARERRLRREVRRLSPCLDALSSLERRVLVLRAGLGGRRALSRGATARRLGISVRRAVAAERRGLGRLTRANRATGCGRGGAPPSFSGSVAVAVAVADAPIVAQVLGVAGVRAESRRRPADRPGRSPFTGGSTRPSEPLGLEATGASSVAERSDDLALMIVLAALATALTSLAVVRGSRVAGEVRERRAERATEQRQEELVESVRRILGDRSQYH